MIEANILILNDNPQERELLQRICSSAGTVYLASTLAQAISFLESKNIHVLVVNSRFASYSSLKGLLNKATSLMVTGSDEEKIKAIVKGWPLKRYVDYYLMPLSASNNRDFLRSSPAKS